jgi:hypothetical protein
MNERGSGRGKTKIFRVETILERAIKSKDGKFKKKVKRAKVVGSLSIPFGAQKKRIWHGTMAVSDYNKRY